ncbi:helix-turn-helix domain-containing protein [Oceanivirga miroungae]|uniref:HTH cro/C1-type domain-containing protein n=1 Tax=Oceanivirga miroungae TaxID=1130046 RepID=A0A6I8MEF1_9FUSO|nr:helix-turn-helix transcriptional regulator [Oceanivirga miroungae]VWL85965.1 hypothetical protein OMES3154_01259 [Oceanivirga miroungae]
MIGLEDRLKELRKEQNYTLDNLAYIFTKEFNMGFDKSSISKWENKKQKITLEALKCYSKYFNVSFDWLMYGIGEKYIKENIGGYQKLLGTNEKLSSISDDINSLNDRELRFLEDILKTTIKNLKGFKA